MPIETFNILSEGSTQNKQTFGIKIAAQSQEKKKLLW